MNEELLVLEQRRLADLDMALLAYRYRVLAAMEWAKAAGVDPNEITLDEAEHRMSLERG